MNDTIWVSLHTADKSSKNDRIPLMHRVREHLFSPTVGEAIDLIKCCYICSMNMYVCINLLQQNTLISVSVDVSFRTCALGFGHDG